MKICLLQFPFVKVKNSLHNQRVEILRLCVAAEGTVSEAVDHGHPVQKLPPLDHMGMMADDQVGNGNGIAGDLLLIAVRGIIAVFFPGVHDGDDRGAAGLAEHFRLALVLLRPVAGKGSADAQEADPQAFVALPECRGVRSEPADAGRFKRGLGILVSRLAVIVGMVVRNGHAFDGTQRKDFRIGRRPDEVELLFLLRQLPVGQDALQVCHRQVVFPRQLHQVPEGKVHAVLFNPRGEINGPVPGGGFPAQGAVPEEGDLHFAGVFRHGNPKFLLRDFALNGPPGAGGERTGRQQQSQKKHKTAAKSFFHTPSGLSR